MNDSIIVDHYSITYMATATLYIYIYCSFIGFDERIYTYFDSFENVMQSINKKKFYLKRDIVRGKNDDNKVDSHIICQF